jgi:hypothetical protein
MNAKKLFVRSFALFMGVVVSAAVVSAGVNNVGFDSRILQNGGFTFSDVSATYQNPVGFGSFTVSALTDGDGSNGIFGGIGIDTRNNWDLGGWNFVAADYQLEVTYKPTSNNTASAFNVVGRQEDGFDLAGLESGEEYQWGFFDIVNQYNAGTPDADGFVTITRDLTPEDFRQQAFGYANDGDMLQDFDVHQGGLPNGISQMQIQVPFGSTDPFEVEFKSVRFAPKTPDPTEIARIDFSGFDLNFDSAANGAARRDDGSAFTNLIYDAENIAPAGNGVGGVLGTKNLPSVEVFDGADYAIEFTAKLLPTNAASQVNVVLKDLDGDDSAPGMGAEEWGVAIDTSELNATTMTTLTIPLSDAGLFADTAFGFTNTGDGMISDLNLYEFHIQAPFGTFDRLSLEIESVRIIEDASSIGCDLNGDTMCDTADADLLVADIAGGTGLYDVDGSGMVDGDDLTAWLALAGAENLASGNPYLAGDANLDGSVNGQDFVAWNGSKFTNTAAWSAGDFNADGSVDGQDFVIWNGNKFQTADVAAVPEPALGVWGIVLALGLVRFSRR